MAKNVRLLLLSQLLPLPVVRLEAVRETLEGEGVDLGDLLVAEPAHLGFVAAARGHPLQQLARPRGEAAVGAPDDLAHLEPLGRRRRRHGRRGFLGSICKV